MSEEDGRIPVEVRVSTFRGHGTHVHVVMRERHTQGRERMMKFHSREAAERWIDYTYKREFGEKTHRLVYVDDIQKRWFYREGD